MNFALVQKKYPALKAALTRAYNSNDPVKLKKAAETALAFFEENGWPDNWALFERAKDDAEFALARERKTLYD